MPWSEVCVAMGVASHEYQVELLRGRMAQLWSPGGEKFSAPITTGEAGIYEDARGFYCYPETDRCARCLGSRKLECDNCGWGGDWLVPQGQGILKCQRCKHLQAALCSCQLGFAQREHAQ
jgi:hypothetical protein